MRRGDRFFNRVYPEINIKPQSYAWSPEPTVGHRRPSSQAQRTAASKPRVSAFTSANIDKILALKPDLVLTFSDLQADIAADLIRRGLDVHAFNQRSVAGIPSRRLCFRAISTRVGSSVLQPPRAVALNPPATA